MYRLLFQHNNNEQLSPYYYHGSDPSSVNGDSSLWKHVITEVSSKACIGHGTFELVHEFSNSLLTHLLRS